MKLRRAAGALLVLGCGAGIGWLHFSATDFPVADPIEVVDAALVERLRAEPGLHLALAEEYEVVVPLDLRDDPLNRLVYGTSIDVREAGPSRSAIHIQRKGTRSAIHTDDHSPKAGAVGWLLHATVDVPFLELLAGLLVGAVLLLGGRQTPASQPVGEVTPDGGG
jgi:hypothetical protein